MSCHCLIIVSDQKMSPISPAISESTEAEMTTVAEIFVFARCNIAFDNAYEEINRLPFSDKLDVFLSNCQYQQLFSMGL